VSAARSATAALAAMLALLAPRAAAVTATVLSPPAGLHWGASPQEVQTSLAAAFKFVGPTTAPDPDVFLYEQRFAGDVLGYASDHVAPMFYAGRLFSVAVSYSPAQGSPASLVWDALVEKLSAQYGPPKTKTKPLQLVSFLAILRLLPDTANKSELMTLYNAAEKDREGGTHAIYDLEIQAGSWVPEATWSFANGASVKALMRAGVPDQTGLRALKPAVVYSKYEMLK
jgi:hypothetical protein